MKPPKPSLHQLVEQTQLPHVDKDILNDERAQRILDFLEEHGLSLPKLEPKNFDVLEESFFEKKKAYPNYDSYMSVPGQHDLQKWFLSAKDIYYRQKAGLPYKEAIKAATQGWKKMEIYDFLNWLRYYQEGAQMKYKTAQVWYENPSIPGYFLEIKKDKEAPQENIQDTQAADEARAEAERQEKERNEEKHRMIEFQRKKIIGRLDAAEKLLRSHEGQQFAGPELENLMIALYDLKRKVQLVNKLSLSTRLYEDMIIREANILSRNGFVKAANVLYSVAQTPGANAESAQGTTDAGQLPTPPSPPDPSGAGQSGTMAGLPATAPGVPSAQTTVNSDQNNQPSANSLLTGGDAPTGMAESSPALIPQEAPQPKGISEFIQNMNDGSESEADNLQVSDPEEDLMVSEAQALPPGVPPAVLEDIPMTDEPTPERGNPVALTPEALSTPKQPKALVPEEPLEVSEKDIPAPQPEGEKIEVADETSAFDSKVDQVFANVSVADIVAELEILSQIFKVREIPRRLSIIDLMLDAKGLSSYFPQLGEAMGRSLENNNYVSIRIEDVLSKLRGAIPTTKEIDLSGGTANAPAEVADMKGKLQSDEAKEKQQKQMRKERDEAKLTGKTEKVEPTVDIGELGAPVKPVAAPIQPKA